MSRADRAAEYFRELQDASSPRWRAPTAATLPRGQWERPGGGGGRTRVLADGAVFEKAGVNFSDVHGEFRPEMARAAARRRRCASAPPACRWCCTRATRASRPCTPTSAASTRGAACWFGGGADLTPYYLVPRGRGPLSPHAASDVCARTTPASTRASSDGATTISSCPTAASRAAWAASSSTTWGRRRGDRAAAATRSAPRLEADRSAVRLRRALGDAFIPAYLPIVERRRNEPVGEAERAGSSCAAAATSSSTCIYDRGTIFGLKTDGRIESILMSLPPEVRWEYGARARARAARKPLRWRRFVRVLTG